MKTSKEVGTKEAITHQVSSSCMQFKFERLNLEVTVSRYSGNRQLDLNSGVEIIVNPEGNRIAIACDDFKSHMKKLDLNYTYQDRYGRQALEINKLIKLIDRIQKQINTDEERAQLEEMKTCINNTYLSSWRWGNERVTLYQFFIPGKRVNKNTFELEDDIQNSEEEDADKPAWMNVD